MSSLTTPRKALLALACVAAAGLLLTACSAPGPVAERDTETDEVTTAGSESAFSVKIGDCFNDEGSSDEVSDLPVVPCSEAHDNEVVYLENFDGGVYPGAEAMSEQAAQLCIDQFESIVGFGYEESDLGIFPMYPTEDSWNYMKDREVVCSLYDMSGQVTGTLVGAAR